VRGVDCEFLRCFSMRDVFRVLTYMLDLFEI
jgi:hypothetical protein